MKLSRIRIEQFRQFRQALEIGDLDAGINLFTGPNEAGKSTIVAALRAAFFERHRSGSVEDFRPWGDSSASPSVELDFVVGAQHYRLSKSFLGRRRCELQAGSRHLDGAEAEDHLANLLGFLHANKGASKAEHWGIPGLLWIQQGGAQEVRDAVTHATDHLRSAMKESLGEVASSSGDELMATVEAARNELLTPATGAARGQYAEAIKREAKLASELSAINAEIAAYRQKVDTLSALRREHAVDDTDKPWEGFRRQEQGARDKLITIQRVEEAHTAEKLRAKQVEEQVKLLRGQLDRFASEQEAAKGRQAILEKAQRTQSESSLRVGQWQAKQVEAGERHEKARARLRLARQEDNRRSLTRQLDEIRPKAENAATALAKAEAEQARLLGLQRQAAAAELKLADLEALREQQRQIRELQIRREAAATQLHFALDEGHCLQIGSESLSGSGERLLLAATAITLPGFGRLDIAPGGSDLAQLGRQESELSDRHSALLQRLGLASLAAAESRMQTHGERLGEVKIASATLKALAPKGAEALRSELAGQQARAGEMEAALRQLPPTLDDTLAPPPVAAAEAAEEAAGKSLTQINNDLHQAQLAAANAQATCEAAAREQASAKAILDSPERAERLATANRDLVDGLAEQSTLAARVDALHKQISEARPDILKQDVERFGKSAEQHEKRYNERRDTLLRLEVELETAGAQGLEERSAEFARDLAQAQRRVEELRRRASALDYLLNLLRDKRRALTRKLQAPLQKHLNRYLQLLFARATLEIDENLSPGPLTRVAANGGQSTESGAFEALSFGAREQMGVISRLAYADLLQEAGRPTLIILDDVLVHSDDERLALMKRVLFDAATRHQILLFTCHPANWRDLGVGARSLEALRAAG